MIREPPIEREMSEVEAGVASGMAGDVLGETTLVTFRAASEKWERNKTGRDCKVRSRSHQAHWETGEA